MTNKKSKTRKSKRISLKKIGLGALGLGALGLGALGLEVYTVLSKKDITQAGKTQDGKIYLNDNYLNNSKGLVDYINGPLNMTKFKIGEKEIYIFGDYHGFAKICKSDKKNCVDIPNIFDLIIKSNPHITIDFFLEDPHLKKDLLDGDIFPEKTGANTLEKDIYLIRTRNFYDRTKRTKKYWKNLRLHNIDPRQDTSDAMEKLISIINCISGNCSSYEKDEKYFEKFLVFDATLFEINKQLDNVPIDIKEKIVKFANDKISAQKDKYINCTVRQHKANVMFYIFAIYYDIHLLARLFRNKWKDNNPYESKHVLIYAGEMHTENINEFLESLSESTVKYGKYGTKNELEKITEQVKNMDPNSALQKFKVGYRYKKIIQGIEQCVDVKSSNLPFFENAPPSETDKKKITEIINSNNYNDLDNFYNNYHLMSFGKVSKKHRTSKKKKVSKKRRTSKKKKVSRKSRKTRKSIKLR
jgi:hypothetical protein